jgi:hypothetical protein
MENRFFQQAARDQRVRNVWLLDFRRGQLFLFREVKPMGQTLSRRTLVGHLTGAVTALAISTPFAERVLGENRLSPFLASEAEGFAAAADAGAKAVLDNHGRKLWTELATSLRAVASEPALPHDPPAVLKPAVPPIQLTRGSVPAYYGVDRLPFISKTEDPPAYAGLNVPELVELQNTANMNLYCGCGDQRIERVPIVNDYRRQLTASDLQRFSGEMASLNLNPDWFVPQYRRTFCDCSTGQTMVGFGFALNCQCIQWTPLDIYGFRSNGLTISRAGQGFRVVKA